MRFLRLALVFVALASGQADARFPRGSALNAANVGGMLMNLNAPAINSGYSPFLNWWAGNGSAMTLVSTINGTLQGQQIADCPISCTTPTTYLDSNGELISPLPSDVTSISKLFFTTVAWPQYQYEGTAFGAFAGQVFNAKWSGCGSPNVSVWFGSGSLGTGGSSSLNVTPNVGSVTLGSSGFSNVGLTFTFTGIPACYTSPPKQIFVSQSQYATNVTNGEIWNPDWLATVKPFYMQRLMDWMATNASGISDSSQLADASYTAFAQPFLMGRSDGGNGVSGTTLTLGGTGASSQLWKSGYTVYCSVTGCPSGGMVISSQLTGTSGGNGTYQLNANYGTIGDGIYLAIPNVGAGSLYGKKGGVSPTLACSLANAANSNIEYPIPAAATDQFVTDVATSFKSCLNAQLKVKISYCNENWNSGAAFSCYRYVNAKDLVHGGPYFAGYRAAQIMKLVADVFGTPSYSYASPNGSRWIGAIGGQLSDVTQAGGAIIGAKAYIATGISYTLTQLFTQVDIAPYWGNFWTGASDNMTGISVGTTPTITVANNFTNGQIVRLFVNGGTMAALNNMDVTVSSASGSSFVATPFNGSNPSTTGLTYGGSNNQAIDSTLFRLADRSAALNGSTPATYPTKFAYFNQQMSKAILNGSATDASYGTLTIAGSLYLTTGAGSILDGMQQNALIAQQNGLEIGQYEGSPTQLPIGWNVASNTQIAIVGVEYMGMSLFDAGVTGDTTNTSANLFKTAYSQFNSVNGIYPAQFNDATYQSQFGPWGALRFVPGDTGNVKWGAITAQNALGPWVNPTPAPTWSLNYNSSTDKNFSSGSATSVTCPITPSGSGLVVVGITWTNSTALSSVTIDGVGGGAMTADSDNHVTWGAAIYSKAVTGTAARTITITWSGAVPFRSCYAMTLTGLASSSALSQANAQKTMTIGVTGGSFMLAVSTLVSAPTFNTCGTTGSATGTVTQVDNNATQASGIAYWSPGPSFTAAQFLVCTSGANGTAIATYK